MPFFRVTEGDRIVADFRVNGVHHVTYRNVIVPKPLLSSPLRSRTLDASVLKGAKLKVGRARKLVQDLHTELDLYLQSSPIEAEGVAQSDGGNSYRMRITAPLPESVSAIAGDAIHNLRSALDLLVCDLVRQNGNEPIRANSYPTSPKGFSNQVKGVSPEAKRFLSRVRTASRANEAILLLHQLDILDKHNRIIAVAGATASVYARVGMPFISWGPTPEQAAPFPGVVGMPTGVRNAFLCGEWTEVYRTSPGVDEEVRIKVCPVFSQGLPAEGEPLMDMLQLFGGLVERIVILAERRLY